METKFVMMGRDGTNTVRTSEPHSNDMIGPQYELLSLLGFRFGPSGPHAARTMMLDELRQLFEFTSPEAERPDYAAAVVDANMLGKPTRRARELTLRYLTALYGLEISNPIFRALRRLWPLNEAAQPLLALAASLARDSLLRSTQPFILALPIGASVPREAVEDLLSHQYPDRFSPASLKSFAQNVAGTWTAAGLLSGHRNKVRARPQAHPESVSMLLFLGYLMGRTGQRLFASEWTSLLRETLEEMEALANSASNRGLLVFMNAGGVKEVRFPGYLTPEEERTRREILNVI